MMTHTKQLVIIQAQANEIAIQKRPNDGLGSWEDVPPKELCGFDKFDYRIKPVFSDEDWVVTESGIVQQYGLLVENARVNCEAWTPKENEWCFMWNSLEQYELLRFKFKRDGHYISIHNDEYINIAPPAMIDKIIDQFVGNKEEVKKKRKGFTSKIWKKKEKKFLTEKINEGLTYGEIEELFPIKV